MASSQGGHLEDPEDAITSDYFSLEKKPTQFNCYHSEVLSPSPTNVPMNPTLTRSGGRGHRALLGPGSVISCLQGLRQVTGIPLDLVSSPR